MADLVVNSPADFVKLNGSTILEARVETLHGVPNILLRLEDKDEQVWEVFFSPILVMQSGANEIKVSASQNIMTRKL